MDSFELPRWPQEDARLPAERIPLSPSGISPWSHEVELHNGQLCLYWQENGHQRVRMFTSEETCRLAEYMHDYKQAIFFPQQEA